MSDWHRTRKTKNTLSTRLARLLVRLLARPAFARTGDPARLRQSLARLSRIARYPKGTLVRSVQVGDVRAHWIAPGESALAARPTILYFHGGGFVGGSVVTHGEMAARLSLAAGVRVLLPDYRLAPEHTHPAALDDCLAAWRWLRKEGVAAGQIVLAGDSAGGCLTLMVLLSLREAGEELPASAVLLSPLTDALHFDGESYQTRAGADPFFASATIPALLGHYTGPPQDAPAILCPRDAALAGLPPLLIHVGDDEVLLSDSTRLAKRAREAGVEVELNVWEKLWHVFPVAALLVPEGRKAIAEMGVFVSRRLG